MCTGVDLFGGGFISSPLAPSMTMLWTIPLQQLVSGIRWAVRFGSLATVTFTSAGLDAIHRSGCSFICWLDVPAVSCFEFRIVPVPSGVLVVLYCKLVQAR